MDSLRDDLARLNSVIVGSGKIIDPMLRRLSAGITNRCELLFGIQKGVINVVRERESLREVAIDRRRRGAAFGENVLERVLATLRPRLAEALSPERTGNVTLSVDVDESGRVFVECVWDKTYAKADLAAFVG